MHRLRKIVVDLRTFDEVVWPATYPSETDACSSFPGNADHAFHLPFASSAFDRAPDTHPTSEQIAVRSSEYPAEDR
jgi:hypothetical protein